MKVTAIAIVPPKDAENNPKATPELLASSLAKYSRSNSGLQSILDKIDWNDPDASVERIFKFIDYGHASIGGLTGGIAIAVDDVSMFAAYKIFEISQLLDGQESSTRYIEMVPKSLLSPEEIGLDGELAEKWLSVMEQAFTLYQKYYKELDNDAQKNPEKLRIPNNIPQKVKNRIRKNYALDRCRYFIPFATKTSAAYIMTARVWADTLKKLDSIDLPEIKNITKAIRSELKKFAPRLIKHSYADESSKIQIKREFEFSSNSIKTGGVPIENIKDEVFISIDDNFPSFLDKYGSLEENFDGKLNRYSTAGVDIKRVMVRFAFNNIAIAELRDLNRHRSGYRFSYLNPVGFYLPNELSKEDVTDFLHNYAELVKTISLTNSNGLHIYGYLLGTQTPFEHSTHLDKFIYESELRTGLGAHFRYAEHLEKAVDSFLELRPQYEPFIERGTAEPE